MAGHVKKMVVLMAVTIVALFASCGGSSSGPPTTPATVPISLENLVGATDIAVDSSFQLEIEGVDCATVTSSTFFIVLASSGNDPSAALPATIECDPPDIILNPDSNLTGGTSYTVFATTGIDPYNGASATFTTTGTNGVATVSSDSCSSTLHCDSDQYCFYNTCEDYSDIGVDTSVDCTNDDGDGDSTICVAQLGAPAGYDTDDWECLPTINTSAACSYYCVVVPTFFGYDGYPATESACDATDNATWMLDYNACLTDESLECSGDSGSVFAVVGHLKTEPPDFGGWVGISDQEGDWPLTLTDVTACDTVILQAWINGRDDCEQYECIGLSTSAQGSYRLMDISSLSTTTTETTNVADAYIYMTTSEIISALDSIGASSGDTIYFNYWWDFQGGTPQRSGSTPYDVRIIFTQGLCD